MTFLFRDSIMPQIVGYNSNMAISKPFTMDHDAFGRSYQMYTYKRFVDKQQSATTCNRSESEITRHDGRTFFI